MTSKQDTDKAIETIVTARINLLMKQPFYGNLATRLKLVVKEDIPTAATDGRNLYFNPDFVNKLKFEEVIFLCGHEILHCVFEHLDRFGERNKQLANIAADYVVNSELNEAGFKLITTVPCLYEEKYRGWSFEQVYEDIQQQAKKNGKSLQDMLDKLLDEHMEPGEGEGGMSEEEKQMLRDEIREAVIEAARQAGAGHIPKGVRRMLKELDEPTVDWREYLQQQIVSLVKKDFTFIRPSRRAWSGMDAILPGMNRDQQVEVTVAIDASGSVSQEMLRDFLSEIKGITEQFSEFKVDVLSFDTKVYNHQNFTSDNLDDITEYEVKGGGGTMFECFWEYLRDNEIQPGKLVVLTDMYPCGKWAPEGMEDYCDTIWIAHSANNIEAPFGTTVHYNK